MLNNNYLKQMLFDSDSDLIGFPDGIMILDKEQIERYEKLIMTMEDIFKEYDFNKIIIPSFDYYEAFLKTSEKTSKNAFTFKDKDGKLLSLCYDMTTPVARIVSLRCKEEDLPVKNYYSGYIYREQDQHKGKLRQSRQCGVEYISNSLDNYDNVIIINILCKCLEKINNNFVVVLGDVRLYKYLISKINFKDNNMIYSIHNALLKKDKKSLEIILSEMINNENKEYIEELILLTEKNGDIEEINKLFSKKEEFREIIDEINFIYNKIDDKYKNNIIIDFSLLKEISYYTSLTIEGYIESSGYPVANGGRYDDLFRVFNKEYKAIGFAIDIDYCL